MKHYLSHYSPPIRVQLDDQYQQSRVVSFGSGPIQINNTFNSGIIDYTLEKKQYCTHLVVKEIPSNMNYRTSAFSMSQEVKNNNTRVSRVEENAIAKNDNLYEAVITENFHWIANLLQQITPCYGSQNDFTETLIGHAIALNKTSVVHYLLKKGIHLPSNFDIAHLQNKLIIFDDYGSLIRLGSRLQINKIEHTSGCAPLHLAVWRNNNDMTKFLLQNQADVNHLDALGNSPLSLAICQRNSPIVKLLLENKANPTLQDEHDIRSFQLVCGVDFSKIFSAKQDVGAEYAYKKRINQKILQKDLMEATHRQDINDVQLLLFSANFEDIKDIFAQAVHIAIKHGNLNLVRLFSQKCGDPKLFLKLFDNSESPTLCALRHHKQDIIAFLVQISIFPLGSSKDIEGSNTALYRSIKTEKSTMLIDVAISQGAEINTCDQTGSTPLHYAITSSNTEIVQLLLLYQANPNVPNNVGQTALHIAADKGYKEMMQILLQSSADPTIIDYYGRTAEETYRAKTIESVCIRPGNIEDLQCLFNDLSKLNGNNNILYEGALCMSDIIDLD